MAETWPVGGVLLKAASEAAPPSAYSNTWDPISFASTFAEVTQVDTHIPYSNEWDPISFASTFVDVTQTYSGGSYTPPDGYLFFDDFASGDLSHTEGGVSWGASNAGYGASAVTVSASNPKSGAYALDFYNDGGADWLRDAWVEQRVSLGAQLSELWVRADVYIPANYVHRDIMKLTTTINSGAFAAGDLVHRSTETATVHDVDGSTIYVTLCNPSTVSSFRNPNFTLINDTQSGNATVTAITSSSWNNKAFYCWSGAYDSGNFKIGSEMYPSDVKAGSSHMDYNIVGSDGSTSNGHKYTPSTTYWVDLDVDPGNWIEWIFQAAPATNTSSSDGIYRVWKDGTKVINKTNLSNASTNNNYINNMYLEGWKNSGYTDDTTTVWDNVVIATSNIFGVS